MVPVPGPRPVGCPVPWCREHTSDGCLGYPVAIPGTDLVVWLAAGPDRGTLLMVEGGQETCEVSVRL